MKKVASVETSDYYLLDSGIIYSRITVSHKITQKDVIQGAEALRKIKGDGEKLLLISDITLMAGMDRDARKYSEKEAGYDELIKANAIIVKSTVARLIGNFLRGLNKGNFPMKIFSKEEDATKWLKQFQEEQVPDKVDKE